MRDEVQNRGLKYRVLAVLLMCVWACASASAQKDRSDVDKMVELLLANRRACGEELKSFSVDHTVTMSPAEEQQAGSVREGDLKRGTKLTWAGGKWRKEVANASMVRDGNRTKDNDYVTTYDGNARRELITVGKQSNDGQQTAQILAGDALYGTIDYAFFHDRIRDRHVVDFLDENRESIVDYEQTADSLILQLNLQDGSGSYILTLDPRKDFHLATMEFTDADDNFSKMDIQLGEFKPGVWLPSEGTCETYAKLDGELALMRTLRLEPVEASQVRINEEYAPSFFHVEFPDGTYVTDMTAGGVSYVQGTEEKQLISEMSASLWKFEKEGLSPGTPPSETEPKGGDRSQPVAQKKKPSLPLDTNTILFWVCLPLAASGGIFVTVALLRRRGAGRRDH
jgi:hypothetical protein